MNRRAAALIAVVFLTGILLGRHEAKKFVVSVGSAPLAPAVSPSPTWATTSQSSQALVSAESSPIPAVTPVPAKRYSRRSSVQERIKRAQSTIPLRQALKNYSEEELHSRAHLIPFGVALGQLVQALEEQDPDRSELDSALDFFSSCGRNADALTSAREQCVANWLRWGGEKESRAVELFGAEWVERAKD